MILAFEGAPGVGKSTIAAALALQGAFVIPEVNRLFAKPFPEPLNWNYERHNARWEMAQLRDATASLVVLEGDPFHPIWFSWIYPEINWPTPSEAVKFYRTRIADRRMMFPDKYVFVHIAEQERRDRMLARELAHGVEEERAKKKIEHYSRMVKPQERFFRALGEYSPDWVIFVEACTLEGSLAVIASAERPKTRLDDLETLAFIADWIETHSPES